MAPKEDVPATGEVEALSALYSSDREKTSSLANERLAIVALQLTYLGLAAIALGGERPIGGAWVAAFSAAPLWFMNAYHQLLVAASLTRSKSVDILEQALFERAGLPADRRDQIGHRAGSLVRDITRQVLPFKIQAAICYVGIGAALIAFTIYALVVSASSAGGASPPVILASLFYLCFMASGIVGWRRTAKIPRID